MVWLAGCSFAVRGGRVCWGAVGGVQALRLNVSGVLRNGAGDMNI